jgi:toxin FitB
VGSELLVLDTDVASLWWRGRLPRSLQQELLRRVIALTFVTHAEWWQWTYVRRWGQRRIDELRGFAGNFELIACDDDVVKAWGRLSGSAMAAGTTVPANDCWIAACCVVHGYPLLSGNLKQFGLLESYGLRLLHPD